MVRASQRRSVFLERWAGEPPGEPQILGLEVYTRPYEERFPQVCLDEKSKQLVGEVREPLATSSPGQPARHDYERVGTANLFMVTEPLVGWRHISVTERRTKLDWAQCIKELVGSTTPRPRRSRREYSRRVSREL